MTRTQTFGRMPTLGEMKEYYARDDVLSFLYDECRMRNVDIAFRRKRWPITPASKNHLQEIIQEAIESKVERAYKNSPGPIDDVRLAKFDYLSFHSRTSITSGEKLIGFDMIFEADMQGWRRSFEDLYGVIQLLDDFGVCYRMKYSGVRSLHFMIPFEAFPRQFNGEPVLRQRSEIQDRVQKYFRRYCGMERAHGGSVMRLAYSLNEDNGLVSLPISSHELSSFRPWKANIQSVTIDKPWHGDVPSDASRKMLRFLREIHKDDAKFTNITPGLEIAPKESYSHAAESDEGSIERWAEQLRSGEEAARVEAAWNLMSMPEPTPVSVLEQGLADESPDVRWYMTESLQKRLDDHTISLAGRMLLDDDQFVRISAIDALALANEKALDTLWSSVADSVSGSSGASFSDIIYAVGKICRDDKERVMKSLVESGSRTIGNALEKAIDNQQRFWLVSSYLQQLRQLCRQYDISEGVLVSEATRLLVPKLLSDFSRGTINYYHVSTLQKLQKNEAVPLTAIREIADSLEIGKAEVPSSRMPEEERDFLTSVVRDALKDMSPEQKARILAAFMLHGKKRLLEPSARILLKIGMWEAVDAIAHVLAQRKVSADRVITIVDKLKQMEPAIERALSEKVNEADGAWALIGKHAEIFELMEALRDERQDVREWAIRALGRMGRSAREAVPALVDILFRDEISWTRRCVARALGRIGGTGAISALIRAFTDQNRSVRKDAMSSMKRIGQPAVPALVKALRDNDALVRYSAARLLGRVREATALPALIEALQDKNAPVRGVAARALGSIGHPDAIPVLIEASKDEKPTVRAASAAALGMIRDPAAVPALTEALKREDGWVRHEFARALRNIETTEAAKAVEKG